jgi:hypothetical protein
MCKKYFEKLGIRNRISNDNDDLDPGEANQCGKESGLLHTKIYGAFCLDFLNLFKFMFFFLLLFDC